MPDSTSELIEANASVKGADTTATLAAKDNQRERQVEEEEEEEAENGEEDVVRSERLQEVMMDLPPHPCHSSFVLLVLAIVPFLLILFVLFRLSVRLLPYSSFLLILFA